MEDVTERLERPGLGTQGEPCPECGTALARDQRYCLTCGARRAGVSARLAGEPERRPPSRGAEREVVSPAPAAAADSPWRLDAGLLAGVGCLLLALLVGVLIGRSGGSSDSQRASTPQVVQLGGAAGTGTAATGAGTGSTATASFGSDWPDGKRGFTVQLQTLPKHGTDAAAVAAAKQAATAKGAPDVGALDSNGYGTLDPGNYVIFSGQYADRKAAAAALKKLKGSFAGAKVVEVASSGGGGAQTTSASSGDAATGKTKAPSAAQQAAGAKAIQDIQNSSGADYSKKSAKLPKTLVTPGAPPAIDKSKPAGGGSGSETFK